MYMEKKRGPARSVKQSSKNKVTHLYPSQLSVSRINGFISVFLEPVYMEVRRHGAGHPTYHVNVIKLLAEGGLGGRVTLLFFWWFSWFHGILLFYSQQKLQWC